MLYFLFELEDLFDKLVVCHVVVLPRWLAREVFLCSVGQSGLFEVFEYAFLSVDDAFDHSIGFLNLDESLLFEFLENSSWLRGW